jgi:hypothetical protein
MDFALADSESDVLVCLDSPGKRLVYPDKLNIGIELELSNGNAIKRKKRGVMPL